MKHRDGEHQQQVSPVHGLGWSLPPAAAVPPWADSGSKGPPGPAGTRPGIRPLCAGPRTTALGPWIFGAGLVDIHAQGYKDLGPLPSAYGTLAKTPSAQRTAVLTATTRRRVCPSADVLTHSWAREMQVPSGEGLAPD